MAISLGFACVFLALGGAPSWPLYHRPGLGWTVQIAHYKMKKAITGLTGYLGHTVHFMGFNGLPLA